MYKNDQKYDGDPNHIGQIKTTGDSRPISPHLLNTARCGMEKSTIGL